VRRLVVAGTFFVLSALIAVMHGSASSAPSSRHLAYGATGAMLTPGVAFWTGGGPYGGYVNSLAMDPLNPDVIYAGTESGVFKTVDAGATWTRTGFPPIRVRVVQVSPRDPNILYVGTDDGVYRTTDGGVNWTRRGLDGARVNALAIDATNANILYAGTGWPWQSKEEETIGIFKSTDGGQFWQLKLADGLDAVATLLIDTGNPSHIYAGVYTWSDGPGLRKSTNGGESWVSRQVGPYNWDRVVALAMTPAGHNPLTLYAINASGGDVYKSINRGDTWTRTHVPWISPNPPWALAVDLHRPNVVYVGTQYYQGDVYRSIDGGGIWSIQSTGIVGRAPSSFAIVPRNGTVYVGLANGGVFRSADSGETWFPASEGINNAYVQSLVVHPQSPRTVFAAIRDQPLARSDEGGASWRYVGTRTSLTAVALDPLDGSTLFAGQGDSFSALYLLKSTNGGHDWTSRQLLPTHYDARTRRISDIWVKPGGGSILVAVTDFSLYGGGVYKSSDDGATWQRTLSFWTTSLASDPADPRVVYAGTARNGYVFRSLDGGSTWEMISPSGEWVWEVRDIDIDADSRVYAATSSGLLRWDGVVWARLPGLPSDNIRAIAIDRTSAPNTLYASVAGQGAFMSRDGGEMWAPFNEGLTTLDITTLVLSESQPKILYVGTAYGGVWSRFLTTQLYLPLVAKDQALG